MDTDLSVSELPRLHWRVLKTLADGKQHSGQSIADSLGVSRAAIWKSLKLLERGGIEIEHARGIGYQLIDGSMELLDVALIRPPGLPYPVELEVFSELDSTNQFLLDRVVGRPQMPFLCLAEYQSQGRGRRGRNWYAPFATSLNYSLAWPFEQTAFLSGLSLAIGVIVAESLAAVGVSGVMLKWPNDLIVNEKKLAGILIELRGEVGGTVWAVIGVGINVNMSHDELSAIDQPWVSCRQVVGAKLSRNLLARELTQRLFSGLVSFQEQGFSAFTHRWRSLDWLRDKPISIDQGDRKIAAIARGVTEEGLLTAETSAGPVNLSSGEVSVRVAD